MSAGGNEFVTESIFVDNDPSRHLSINLYTGLWRCFKTGESGNFFKLVSVIENLPYTVAMTKTIFRSFDYEKDLPKTAATSSNQEILDLDKLTPVRTYSYNGGQEDVLRAWNYLYSRKLFDVIDDKKVYYISSEPRLRDRIIIPFELENDKFVFYQARALDLDTQPKYLTPKFDNPLLKPSNLLYPFNHDLGYVVVVEGVIDAISLQLQGINATAIMGAHVSYQQAVQLKESGCEVILGFDNDEAGKRCTEVFDKTRRRLLMPEFKVASLPKGVKDWNEAHSKSIKFDKNELLNAPVYNFGYKMQKSLSSL